MAREKTSDRVILAFEDGRHATPQRLHPVFDEIEAPTGGVGLTPMSGRCGTAPLIEDPGFERKSQRSEKFSTTAASKGR